MSFSNFTSTSLKSLAKLIGKKDGLIAEIEKIEAQIAAVITGTPAKATGKRRGRPAKKESAAKKVAPAKKGSKVGKRRATRGGLKEKILSALEGAGDAGVKVVDLAKKLGVKGTNLHIWFATTGKKNPGIKKVGKGHYKLAGK